MIGAVELTGIPLEKHTFLFLGAGEAGASLFFLFVFSPS